MAEFKIINCPVCNGKDFLDFLDCKDHFVSNETFTVCKCASCDFKFTKEVPDEKNIGSYYQSDEYISHSNTSKGLINGIYHFARQFMLGQKRRNIENSSGRRSGSLLDIGAGTGFFAAHMKQHGWNVTGTEKSASVRDFAKTEFKIELKESGDLFSLNKESFDVITMWHVLEHVQDLDKNILKIKDLLKSDGKLFIAVPNSNSYDAGHYKEYWAAFDVPRHLWHFTPKHLSMLFEKYQLKLVKKYRMPFDSFYISLMSEKYKKSGMSFLKGIFHGKISWLVSLLNKDKCSSVIYVLKKN